MANPIFAAVDLSTYTLSATSTDANFPLTNLQTYYDDDVWKSSSTSAQTLVIDFGAAKACDYIVLSGRNFGNADSVTLQAATNLAFTSGLVTPIAAGVIDPSTNADQGGPGYHSFASVSKRYWRLSVNIATPPLANVPYVGNWFLGAQFDLSFPYDFPFKNQNPEFETSRTKALDGRLRNSNPYDGRKTWEFDVSMINDATKASFQTFVRTVRGRGRAFYFLEPDGTTLNYVNTDFDVDPSTSLRPQQHNIKKMILKSQMVG